MIRRLRYWLESARRSDALQEEMQLHLAETAEELEQEGLSPKEALREARRRFGNQTLHHEDSREVWHTRLLSELAQDLKYALRTLARNKAFSALAVLSLALGIGANTAIYSLMESILLRSLPVSNPESLVVLSWHSRPPGPDRAHVIHSLNGLFHMGSKDAFAAGIFPYAAFETLEKSPVFSSIFAYSNARHRNLTAQGQPASVSTEFVSGAFFETLAVAPAAGRLLSSLDDRSGAPPAAVLSYAAAQQRFGAPQSAVGQPVLVDQVAFTIVGVAPPEFFGIDAADTPALYLPLRTSLLLDGPHAAQLYNDPNHYAVEIMARLRPGVSLAQAQATLAPLFHRWVASTASTAAERERLPNLRLEPGAAGLGRLRREFSKPLYVLFAMVALILTITCANLANLLLARASARRREMAVRLSLGASRLRVVRQLLTESVLLSSLGGALGVLFALWGVRTLSLLFTSGRQDLTFRAGLNWNVLAATAALSLLCGLLFGLVPALQSTRPEVLPALKDGRGPATRSRAQRLLVVAQISMSFLILVAAGLFVRTLDQLQSVQLGYNRENLLLFSINARQTGHRDPEITNFYSDLRQRFAALPGVTSASFAHASLLNASMAGGTLHGQMKIGNVTLANTSVVAAGPGYLTTMQIPLLAGREINGRDQRSAPPVALISQRLARTYFPDENPIGRRIHFAGENRDFEIIGITADLRLGSPKRENPITILVPLAQIEPLGATYALRTTAAPLALADQVREIVRQADAMLPVTNLSTQSAEIDRALSREITFARLCTGFALLALLTACLGLYGTMHYTVSRRISEIGLRMALGAPRSAMLWMVLRQVLLLAAAGLALSLPAALFGARLLKSLLYGTQPNDPKILAAAALALLAAALLAGYAPARRAARIDPLAALRHD